MQRRNLLKVPVIGSFTLESRPIFIIVQFVGHRSRCGSRVVIWTYWATVVVVGRPDRLS